MKNLKPMQIIALCVGIVLAIIVAWLAYTLGTDVLTAFKYFIQSPLATVKNFLKSFWNKIFGAGKGATNSTGSNYPAQLLTSFGIDPNSDFGKNFIQNVNASVITPAADTTTTLTPSGQIIDPTTGGTFNFTGTKDAAGVDDSIYNQMFNAPAPAPTLFP